MMIDNNEEKNQFTFGGFLTNSEIEFISVLLLLSSFFLGLHHQNLCLTFLQFVLIMIPLIRMYVDQGSFSIGWDRRKIVVLTFPYFLYFLSVILSWYLTVNPELHSYAFSNRVYLLTVLLTLYGIYSSYPALRAIIKDDVLESEIMIILFSLLLFVFFISGMNIYHYGVYSTNDRYIIGQGIYPIIILSMVFLSRKVFISLRLGDQNNRLAASLEGESNSEEKIIGEEELRKLAGQIENILKDEELYLSSSLSLSDLSEKTNIPSYRLSYVFNHYFKNGFYQTLGKYRIEYAMELIEKNPNILFDALAEKCGFNSRSTFYKYFKIVNSCTPKEYLEEVNGQREITNL